MKMMNISETITNTMYEKSVEISSCVFPCVGTDAVSKQLVNNDKANLWQQILAQSKSKSIQKSDSNILLFGNGDVGKSALIRGLQEFGSSEVQSDAELFQNTGAVSSLDYAYLNVRKLNNDDDLSNAEFFGICNVWILQNPRQKNMLIQLLKNKDMSLMLAIICLDLSKPWELISQLTNWFSCITHVVTSLLSDYSIEEQDILRKKLNNYVANYQKQVSQNSGNLNDEKMNSSKLQQCFEVSETYSIQEDIVDTLSSSSKFNLGIPIVVVVCKSDVATILDTRACPGQIDVIQAYLRRACLPYAAGIVFTSLKDKLQSKNVLLLYKYIMHLLYGFPFNEQENPKSRDSLFIPIGYDTEDNLREFASKTTVPDLDKAYETIVTQPISIQSGNSDVKSIIAEESMEEFLSKLLTQFPASRYHGQSQSCSNFDSSSAASNVPNKESMSMKAEITTGDRSTIRKGSYAFGHIVSSTNDQLKKGDTKDAQSLQFFFQNLLAKNKGKALAPMAERQALRERPDKSSLETHPSSAKNLK